MTKTPDPLLAELRVLRRMLGIRAVDIAEAAGVHLASISHWENGRVSPHLNLLRAYARAIGYDLALVPLEDES